LDCRDAKRLGVIYGLLRVKGNIFDKILGRVVSIRRKVLDKIFGRIISVECKILPEPKSSPRSMKYVSHKRISSPILTIFKESSKDDSTNKRFNFFQFCLLFVSFRRFVGYTIGVQ